MTDDAPTPARRHRTEEHVRGRDLEPLSRGLRWTFRGLLLLAVLASLTALVPLIRTDQWWVRIWDYPRTQLLAVYAVLAAAVACFMPRRGAAAGLGLLAASCVVQVGFIAPYLPVSPREVEDAKQAGSAPSIRVMACNVLQGNEDHTSILELVREVKPDVLLLLEVDEGWLDDLTDLKTLFPHQTVEPLSNKYGIAFYSRLPVESAEVRHYIKESIPSVVADVRLDGGPVVRLFGVHPNPPRPGEDTTKRDAELVLVGRDARQWGGPALVFGDMNDVGWSRTTNLFQEVSRLLDPRKGRGFYSTFDAQSSWLRYPLDYLFQSDDFRLVEIKRLRDVGSDHFPLLIELSYEPEATNDQEAPDFSQGDAEDAEDAVDKVESGDPEG